RLHSTDSRTSSGDERPESPMSADGRERTGRRAFLKRAGLATVATTLPRRAAGAGAAETTSKPVSVAIIRADPDDPIASAAPAQWAAEQVRQALAGRQVQVRLCGQASEADRQDLCVVYAGRRWRRAGQAALPDAAEALSIESG